jgi:hypothetical protein
MKGIALLIIPAVVFVTIVVVCPLGILIGARVSGPVLFNQYRRFFSSDLYGQVLQRTVLVSALTVVGPIVARVARGDAELYARNDALQVSWRRYCEANIFSYESAADADDRPATEPKTRRRP